MQPPLDCDGICGGSPMPLTDLVFKSQVQHAESAVCGRKAVYFEGSGGPSLRWHIHNGTQIHWWRHTLEEECTNLNQRNTRDVHVKNYSFNYDFGPPLRNCDVTMTCVKGHLTNTIFPPEYDDWKYPPPERLFGAPVETVVEKAWHARQ